MVVRDRFKIQPRVESIAVYEGEIPCTNDDLIRNHAYCWSQMTAADISEKTGIEERCYTELSLEDMALLAARQAIKKAGRRARRNRRCPFLQLHQHQVDPVGGHMAFG